MNINQYEIDGVIVIIQFHLVTMRIIVERNQEYSQISFRA